MEGLKRLRKDRGFTQAELGKLCGVSESIISQYEKGKKNPSHEVVIKLCEVLDCTFSALIGDAPRSRPVISERERKYAALDEYGKAAVDAILDLEYRRCVKTEIIDYGTIRKYLSRPAAGLGGLVDGEDYEDIPRTAETPREADFALVVSGDSMEPYIHDGETIYITEKAALHPMDVGVFCVDGETYVKQYAPSYDGSVYLLSANPERESANVFVSAESNRSMQYFGKVILPKKLPAPVYR